METIDSDCEDKVIDFDPGKLPKQPNRSRDDGGYGVFLFDSTFEVPEDLLIEEKDVAEAFFKWIEKHYPLEALWESARMASEQTNTCPYFRWKGFARQMLVRLIQKFNSDRQAQMPDLVG